VRRILHAALLALCGALLFVASLAGHLLVAVMGIAVVRLAWGIRATSRARPAKPSGLPGPRLRLVRAADDAA
jgi:cytochrome b